MNILLINPPFFDQDAVGKERSIRYVLNIIPPLGLAYLAAVLVRAGFKVGITDYSVEKYSDQDIIKIIKKDKPQIVGISAATPTFISASKIAQIIRDNFHQIVLVIGGAHISAMAYRGMAESCFDIGLIGEGEETFLELAKSVQEKGLAGLEVINGIIFRRGKEFVLNPGREFIKELDALPYPARHLLAPLNRYKPTPASYKKLPLGIIMTSRGCPNQCTFCDRSVFGNLYRQRSAENVLGEIEEVIYKYGAREIRFFDDCFTLDKERTYAICQGIRKFKIPWTCLTTVTSINKGFLKEMKSSGCWQVLYGLESADPQILESLKKGNTLEQNIKAVKLAKEAGLSVRADFIVGTPGETKESLEKTLKFAIDMDLDYAHFNKFVPYPGTSLYKRLTESGYNFNFSEGASITDHLRPLYFPPGVIREDYLKFINYAHKRFYLRPGYLFRRLLSLRTLDEFRGQVRGLFAISALRVYKARPK